MFFAGLAILFGIAVWLRLRSYDEVTAATVPAAAVSARNNTAAPAAPSQTIAPSDPGVIVPVTPSAAENTTTLTPAESARERRYNELLRTPPPPAPGATPVVPPPVVPPPAKERPPANREPVAVKPKPQPQPQATPPPPPQQQPPAPTNSSYPGPSSNSGRGGNDDNDDPDTDLIAPQLLGADFQPPQVQDGDTTVFAVLAQDNLSGVRTVSGVIANPTGNVQGFACQREGDSNRYVTRISVPKDAAAGTWVVKYLTLTDNASNSVNLNASQGALPPTASFRVVASASDTTAPALKAVWVDRAAMRAGDKNTLFVQADDEQTGVSSVNGVFVSPGKQARLAFGCGKNGSGTWECALTPPSCLDCGVWHLEQLQLQDKANNMATIRADNPLVRPVVVDISGDACDSSPPALSTLSLNPLVVSNVEGGTIEVRAVIADDGCGVASLSGQAIPQGGVGGQHAYFTLAPSGDGRTFVGKLEVQKHAAKGTWTIAWLQALDKGHNLRAYAASDPIIARVTFRVE